MQIVVARPPLYDAIRARFGPAVEQAFFAWGDVIYNPSGAKMPMPILLHEEVHCLRQRAAGVDAWWQRYLADKDFRLAEEVLGHRAEYETILKISGNNRFNRRKAMTRTASRLAHPIYDYGITMVQAKRLLKEVVSEHSKH